MKVAEAERDVLKRWMQAMACYEENQAPLRALEIDAGGKYPYYFFDDAKVAIRLAEEAGRAAGKEIEKEVESAR